MVLDVSVSVHHQNGTVAAIKRFTRNIVRELEIGQQSTLVGIVFFAENATFNITLNQYTTNDSLLQAINNISYPEKRGTRFVRVLQLLNATANNQSLGFRPDFKNVGIIVTDGRSKNEPKNLEETAEMFHNSGVYDLLFAVGVSDRVDKTELEIITNNKETAVLLDNIDDRAFDNLQQTVIQQLCEEQSKFNHFH